MEVNETRTVCLLIFFEISENRLNGFENGKTVSNPFESGKMSLFPKKVEYPFNGSRHFKSHAVGHLQVE